MNVSAKTFDLAVKFLGIGFLIELVGIIAINMFSSYAVDDLLKILTGSTLTGLLGLLTSKSPDPDAPAMPVEVVGEPLEVTNVPARKPARRVRRKKTTG